MTISRSGTTSTTTTDRIHLDAGRPVYPGPWTGGTPRSGNAFLGAGFSDTGSQDTDFFGSGPIGGTPPRCAGRGEFRPTMVEQRSPVGQHPAPVGQRSPVGQRPRTSAHTATRPGTQPEGRHAVRKRSARRPGPVALAFGAAGVVVVVVAGAVVFVAGTSAGGTTWQSAAGGLGTTSAGTPGTGPDQALPGATGTGTGDGSASLPASDPAATSAAVGGGRATAAGGSRTPTRTRPTASHTAASHKAASHTAAAPTGDSTGRTPGTTPATPIASGTLPQISPKGATYGQTVDQAEAAPPAAVRPRSLPVRPADRTITGTGRYEAPTAGSASGTWRLQHRGDALTLSGRGYVRVTWELAVGSGTGALRLPVWTGLSGRLFHVASGGGHRMDDVRLADMDPPSTWMGSRTTGYDTLPAGAQQMWQNEYYYLDGTVTLHNLQGKADYHLGVAPTTAAAIDADLRTAPGSAVDRVRFGIVRDTGTDAAPVPQYLTRKKLTATADLLAVPQHSSVS
jgi:hypothetical protein